jgi:hypothetical protein
MRSGWPNCCGSPNRAPIAPTTAPMRVQGWQLKFLVFCLCLLALAPRESHGQNKEYQVKAAFLFNFAEFVQWPDDTYAGTNAPFGAALDETIQGESIGSHKLIVERSRQLGDLKNCQMIFVCKSEKKHVVEILSALGSRPVLTVSEVDGFARSGGGINFYLDGTKVRFDINPAAVRNDRLKITSQLMSLGKIVPTGKEDQ